MNAFFNFLAPKAAAAASPKAKGLADALLEVVSQTKPGSPVSPVTKAEVEELVRGDGQTDTRSPDDPRGGTCATANREPDVAVQSTPFPGGADMTTSSASQAASALATHMPHPPKTHTHTLCPGR